MIIDIKPKSNNVVLVVHESEENKVSIALPDGIEASDLQDQLLMKVVAIGDRCELGFEEGEIVPAPTPAVMQYYCTPMIIEGVRYCVVPEDKIPATLVLFGEGDENV